MVKIGLKLYIAINRSYFENLTIRGSAFVSVMFECRCQLIKNFLQHMFILTYCQTYLSIPFLILTSLQKGQLLFIFPIFGSILKIFCNRSICLFFTVSFSQHICQQLFFPMLWVWQI